MVGYLSSGLQGPHLEYALTCISCKCVSGKSPSSLAVLSSKNKILTCSLSILYFFVLVVSRSTPCTPFLKKYYCSGVLR